MTYVLWTYNDTGAILAVKATPTLECDGGPACERDGAMRVMMRQDQSSGESSAKSGGWPAKTALKVVASLPKLAQGWDGTVGHAVSVSHLERLTLAWPIMTTEQCAAWEEESNYGGW